ncbi:MAG: PKD domain-containing protein [Thermoplasmatales archaeon]|nr:MAG: PKD domain-containing protein [Thermoplasmatales archaeon]
MKGRTRLQIFLPTFVICMLLISLFIPPILADDKLGLSFNPIPNEPPSKPINPDPFNGSVDIVVPVILNVDVFDASGYTVDVYFYNASNDALIGVDYDVPCDWSTASVIWNEPLKGMICYWYVIVRDQEYENRSETWIFATRPNQPPVIHNNEYPANQSKNVGLNVTCHIEVSDIDEDLMTIYWYENSTGSWILRQINSSVPNGTYYWTYQQAIDYSKTYYWKVSVNDSKNNNTEIFHFTTLDNQPVIIYNPIPANQSVNVSKNTAYWYITIDDPENDFINWTIETSPYIGNSSGTNDTNGQKNCPLYGLNYITNYTIYVNATDSINGTWINETFWFITAEQGAPTISNEYPPNRNTQTELQPICHVDVHDIEGDNLTIYWFENSTGSWILRRTESNVSANSTVYWTFSQASTYSKTYYWRVIANDSTVNTTATYYFTTKPKPSSTPSTSPGGGGGVAPPANKHPIAKITGPENAYINETVIFYSYYSYDPDGYIEGYSWDFENDGVFDTEYIENIKITHKYSKLGNYTVRLKVKDNLGAESVDSYEIKIIELETPKQLPIPLIEVSNFSYTNKIIYFNGNSSYDPDGEIVNYTWDFDDGNISYLKNPVHVYSIKGNYTITLTVKDNDNLSNSIAKKIRIVDKEDEKLRRKEQPLVVILWLFMILIATIFALYLIQRKYQITLMIERANDSKKNKYNNKFVDLVLRISNIFHKK